MSDEYQKALTDFSDEDMTWAEGRYELLEPILQADKAFGHVCAIVGVIDPFYETDLVVRTEGYRIRGRALALSYLLRMKGYHVTIAMEELDTIMSIIGHDGSIQSKSMSELPAFDRLFQSEMLHRQLRTVLIAAW